MSFQKQCKQCGSPFRSEWSKAQFCSKPCFYLNRRKYHYEHTCPQCSKVFVVTDGTERIYCSISCASKAKHAEKRANGTTKMLSCTCLQCGQKFDILASQSKNQRGTYCSRECKDASLKGQPSKHRNFITYTCHTCSKQWDAPARRKDRKKFCSRTCRSIAVIQGMHRNSTSIERETYAALNTLGIEFEPQYRVGWKVVDAFIPSRNTIIECLGDYFHCNPSKYPNGPINEIQKRNCTDDKRRFSTFETQGYTVIKLWEKDIKEQGALHLLKQLLP